LVQRRGAGHLERSLESLETLLSGDFEFRLSSAEMYLQSCKACEDHNWNFSVVIAWALVERLLRLLWERWLDANVDRPVGNQGEKFINSKRRDKFVKGDEFTASVVSEILSQQGQLEFPLYKKLNEARRARNKWLHKLESVTVHDAFLSLELVGEMLMRVEGINLRLVSNG